MITVDPEHDDTPDRTPDRTPGREHASARAHAPSDRHQGVLGGRWAPFVVIGVAFVVAGVACWRHVAGYFFLYDDFALISIGTTNSLEQLLTQALIGFYRPAGFLVMWATTRLFDWDQPGGFAFVSLLLHAINCLLCLGLVRALGLDRLTAALAALLLFLSPWATEAFLWSSAVFDLIATGGVLAALLCVRLLVAPSSSRLAPRDLHVASPMIDPPEPAPRARAVQAALAAGIVLCSLIALFAKESASVLLALAVTWIALAPASPGAPPGARAWRRSALALLCVAVPSALYVVARSRVTGMLAGAYGSFGQLLADADLVGNVWSYARALVIPPLPDDWSTLTVLYYVAFVCPFFVVVVPAVLLRGFAARERARMLAGCVVSYVLCIAPVAWTGLMPGNTTSGRFAYLPGVWFAIAAACALGGIVEPRVVDATAAPPAGNASGRAAPRARQRRQAAAALLALAIACGYYTGSLVHQAGLWRRAASLSRSVMTQMEAYRGQTGRALHVTNLPAVTAEGPFLLKGYAFRLYRGGAGMPPVRADMVLIRLTGDIAIVLPLGDDPFSDYKASEGRPETPVTLRLNDQP